MLHHDLAQALNGTADNFSTMLFRLIIKADHSNLEKIRRGFPLEVLMVEIFRTSYHDDDYIKIQSEAERFIKEGRE